jgi:hypothetical protein
MRRVLATFSWQSEKWKSVARQLEANTLTSSRSFPALIQADILTQTVHQEGQVAYTYRQAAIREKMLSHCKLKWQKYEIALATFPGFDARVMVECH